MKEYSIRPLASLGGAVHSSKREYGGGSSNMEKTATARQARILVVDDDSIVLRLFDLRLGQAGYAVKTACDVSTALILCAQFRPDLIISDLNMEPLDGMELLKEVQKRWPGLCVIMQSANASIKVAVEAAQHGAFAFLTKPVAHADLLEHITRALKISTFTANQGDWRSGIISRSHLMEQRIGQANLAALSDSSVLLVGEVGTGKELFARAIHAASGHRNEAFQVIDCAALSTEPAAGEAKGGLDFTVITPGTLLLEDVDLLSLELQTKLLSALKDSAQLGLKCARLVSTASCELAGLVESGRFRADLAQYLNVLTIEVPPLGRRREDIPLLIGHFLSQAANEAGAVKRYEPKAIEWLASRNWPGNIDQLHSVVKKSLALSPTALITAEFVKSCAGPEAMQRCLSYDEAREEFTRGYLIQHLRITQGNVSQAARLAKRNRTDFYKLMARHNVEPEAFKQQAA